MFEFDPENPQTWKVYEAPSLEPWVNEELTALGGLNPHGKPVLRCVWGATAKAESTEDQSLLKYHCGYAMHEVQGYKYKDESGDWHFTTNIDNLDPSIMLIPCTERPEVGLPRWVIEKWISPYDLEQAGRFQNRCAPGESTPILREFPREGIYDPYFIVQGVGETYHEVDRQVMDFIRHKWHDEVNTTLEQQEKKRAEYRKREREQWAKQKAEINRAAANLDLRLPDEEKDRRAMIDEIVRQAEEKEREEAKKLRFYQTGV